MSRSSEYNKNRHELLEKYKVCEFCGDDRGLEVHHSIPLSVGGDDSRDNLIVCCGKCHAILHRGNRSILTKIGLKRVMKEQKDRERRLFQPQFYKYFNELTTQGERPTFLDACDYIDDYFSKNN